MFKISRPISDIIDEMNADRWFQISTDTNICLDLIYLVVLKSGVEIRSVFLSNRLTVIWREDKVETTFVERFFLKRAVNRLLARRGKHVKREIKDRQEQVRGDLIEHYDGRECEQ